MLGLIDRLDYIRDLGIGSERAGRIHAARLDRLVEEGAIMTVQHIADLEPARRTAILVAQVANLEIRLTDATLAMFEKYIGSLFTKAQNRDERRFQATKRDVAKALILFRRTIAALRQAKETGEDGVAVVDREIGMKRLEEALPIIGSVADVADQDTSSPPRALQRLAPVHSTLSRDVQFSCKHTAGPGSRRRRTPQGNESRRHPLLAQATTVGLPAAKMAQADLREQRSRSTPLRDRGARHVGSRRAALPAPWPRPRQLSEPTPRRVVRPSAESHSVCPSGQSRPVQTRFRAVALPESGSQRSGASSPVGNPRSA